MKKKCDQYFRFWQAEGLISYNKKKQSPRALWKYIHRQPQSQERVEVRESAGVGKSRRPGMCFSVPQLSAGPGT